MPTPRSLIGVAIAGTFVVAIITMQFLRGGGPFTAQGSPGNTPSCATGQPQCLNNLLPACQYGNILSVICTGGSMPSCVDNNQTPVDVRPVCCPMWQCPESPNCMGGATFTTPYDEHGCAGCPYCLPPGASSAGGQTSAVGNASSAPEQTWCCRATGSQCVQTSTVQSCSGVFIAPQFTDKDLCDTVCMSQQANSSQSSAGAQSSTAVCAACQAVCGVQQAAQSSTGGGNSDQWCSLRLPGWCLCEQYSGPGVCQGATGFYPTQSACQAACDSQAALPIPANPFTAQVGGNQCSNGFASATHDIPTPYTSALAIAAGPDGNLWFTEAGKNRIGRVTTSGVFQEYALPDTQLNPEYITAGPDGNIWFTARVFNQNVYKVGRVTPGGSFTIFPLPTPNRVPKGITAGPDGNVWFTQEGKIVSVTPAGTVAEHPLDPQNGAFAIGITAGPDGNLWITDVVVNSRIRRVTVGGADTEYPLPNPASGPQWITAGPDGALWFTESLNHKIGRITTAGAVTEFPLSAGAGPQGIVKGPDGNLWFAQYDAGKIGRITPGGSVLEFPVVGMKPYSVAFGSDGNLWFTDPGAYKIGTLRPCAPGGSSAAGGSSSNSTGGASSPRSSTGGGDGGGNQSQGGTTTCQQCIQQQCTSSAASGSSRSGSGGSGSSRSGGSSSRASSQASSPPGYVACCRGDTGRVVIAARYAIINASRFAPPVSGFTYDLKGAYDDVKQCSSSQTFLMRQWRTEPGDAQVKQFMRHCVDYQADRQGSGGGSQTPGQYTGYCCLPSAGCSMQNADQCVAAGHLSFPLNAGGLTECQNLFGAGMCR